MTAPAEREDAANLPPVARLCLWLWVPPLGASLTLWGHLPPLYRPEYFDLWVPPLLGLAETALKLTAVVISTMLVAGLSQPRQRLGLVLYLSGVAIYLTSYSAQVLAPNGA